MLQLNSDQCRNCLRGSKIILTLITNSMSNLKSKTILFATGAFVSTACWDEWAEYFKSKGYAVSVPPWPNKDAPAATLRSRHPDHAIASNTLKDVLDFFVSYAQGMPEKPIVIGHSLGGLVAQLLASKGISEASVAIHAAPPYGIMPMGLAFFRAGWAPLGYFTPVDESFLFSFSEWQFAFMNGRPLEEQKAAYEKYAIPESKRVVRDGITPAAKIDLAAPHSPLLFVAGEGDHFFTPGLNQKMANSYTDKSSRVDFISFPDRPHGVLTLPTWKEEADYILNWIEGMR